MTKPKSHVPEGLSPVIPQLVVSDGNALVAFVEKAFEAKLDHVMPNPNGKGVMHGMFRIGGVAVFVSDASDFAKPTSANLFVYLPDVDAAVERAKAAGAKVLAPVADMFWGDRWAMLADPWGNVWQVATHKEVLAPEEMMRRMAANAPKG
ncbi:MAG: VOC family protein [Myxococcales bacterium]|nr:VOC family protein [Myxococcales bacterium]